MSPATGSKQRCKQGYSRVIGLVRAAIRPSGRRTSIRTNPDSAALVCHCVVPDPAAGNEMLRAAPLCVRKVTTPEGTP